MPPQPKKTSKIVRALKWLRNPFSKPPSSPDITGDPSNRLKLYLFNVGQGDHILLELPNGQYGIIDFYFEGTLGLKEPPALTYLDNLRRLNPGKEISIAFVCISHPDFDHVKGADTFLQWAAKNQVPIENFWLPAGRDFSSIYNQYKIALRRYARDRIQKDEGIDLKDRLKGIRDYLTSSTWSGHTDNLQGAIRPLNAALGGGVEVILIAPMTRHVGKFDDQAWTDFFRLIIEKRTEGSAHNNLLSAVLLLILNHHKLLFGGDTGLQVWLECLDEFERTRQDKYFGPCVGNFVKVSHHGSRNSSSAELWSRILTTTAKLGISAGKTYRHPHPDTLRDISDAMRAKGYLVQVLSTNTCTECLVNQTIPEESLHHLIYDVPSFPPEVEQSLNRLRPPPRPLEKARPVLGSYIFRFAVDDETVTVTKGLLPRLSRNVKCVYEDHSSREFPDCAQVI